MSEAVEILIKADDKASTEFGDVATSMEKSMKRVKQIITGLETPAEKYAQQIEELNRLHEQGALNAEQFAMAQEKIQQKLQGSGNAIKEVGGKAKSTTEFLGVLASLSGNSQLAGLASQLAGATEKVGQFSEVAKAGKGGALAFKLGLAGLVATIGATVGKAIGDVIFETKKWTKELEKAKEASAELDDQIKKSAATMFANSTEDIELIRDPEEKKAAYKTLLETLNKDVQAVSGNVKTSQAAVDEWADSWQITGDQKEFAKMADDQLKNDKERLAALKEQRDAVAKMVSVRTQENEAIAKANEAKDKSENYIESLRLEIEYLSATKDEQLKLDAARNATVEDQGEAERLLRERDAIIAKVEAEKELEDARKKAIEEQQKAAEKAQEDAAKEVQKVEELIKSEQERLALKKLEIEQGKEAAKAQALINQGVDEATAKQLAAAEAELEQGKETGKKETPTLQASESRLLTRGQSESPVEKTNQLMASMNDLMKATQGMTQEQLAEMRRIAENTSKSVNLVGVT
jgi:hypothetical protein